MLLSAEIKALEKRRGFSHMPFDSIKVGDRAEIKTENNPNAVYLTKVVDILDVKERMISLYRPVFGGSAMPMRTDEEYFITIFTNHSLIRFRCIFEGYLKEEKNFFVVAKILDEGTKVQRREFFRFTCMLAMKFSIIESENNDAASKLLQSYSEKYDAVVRDIGGGGIRFITKQDLNIENPIQCTILLGSNTMLVKGKILEKQYMPKSTMKFQYRSLFLDMAPGTQEEIVNYIFAEQRKQRKMSFAAP